MCALDPSNLPENPDLATLLERQGFDHSTVHSLLLLPMVHVAWADGTLDPGEADAIVELATSSGLLPAKAGDKLRDWISQRPDPASMAPKFELISMLLAALDRDLPVTVDGVEQLAEAVGKATGGVFGMFFRLGSEEKKALATIREKLGVTYGPEWGKTLAALRDDWRIADWVEFDEPADVSGADAKNPLLFTDPKAVEEYESGLFRGNDGKVLTRRDLLEDLEIEVMRTKPWQRQDLQYYVLVQQWLEGGLVEPAGVYWNNSPHGTVYRALANLKFRIDGTLHRIRKGEQVSFMCQMARDSMELDGPLLAGNFAPARDGMLCSDMSGAMMNMSGGGMGEMGGSGMGSSGGGKMGGEMGMPAGGDMKAMEPAPSYNLDKLSSNETDRVAYLVLDRSGSMQGERLRMAKMAVMAFLEQIPPNAGVRVVVRPFDTMPRETLTPVGSVFTPQARMALMNRTRDIRASGGTAMFKAVNTALDDILRLTDGARMTAPKTYLVVLSDGEDTEGIKSYSFAGKSGAHALFERMKQFRARGIVEYLPIAYGGNNAVSNLQELGGPGFEIESTSPTEIVARFGEIRQRLMVGMPMGAGMGTGMGTGGRMGGM